MPTHIRPALASEADRLTQIAYASKKHWGYPDAWMALWREALTLTPAYIANNPVFVAEEATTIAGFHALIGSGTRWELDHLWVLPESIGRGIGSALFRHAVAYLTEHAPGAVLKIESEPNAEPFYIRMGARRVGETTREWQGLLRTLPQLEFRTGAP